jgi:hypothetical protein
MATRLNQAAATERGSVSDLTGSIFAAGFQGSVSDLKKPAAVIGDGISLSGKTLTIEKDGAVLDGVDLRGISVQVDADNVTIKNSFGSANDTFAIHQTAGHDGLTVEHCTFDGQKSDVDASFISSDSGTVTMRHNEFLDIPADVVKAMGGVENNDVAGHADQPGSHPETVAVHEPVSVETAAESATTATAQPSVETSLDPTSTSSVAQPTEATTSLTDDTAATDSHTATAAAADHTAEATTLPTDGTAATDSHTATAAAADHTAEATSAEATTSTSPASAEQNAGSTEPTTTATAEPAAPTQQPTDSAPSQPGQLDSTPSEVSGAATNTAQDHANAAGQDQVSGTGSSTPADVGHGHGHAAGHGHDLSPVHGGGDTFAVPAALESLLTEIRDMLSAHVGSEVGSEVGSGHGTDVAEQPQGDAGASPEHGFIWFELESFLAKIGHLNEHLQDAASTVEAHTAAHGHIEMNTKIAPSDHDLLL